MAPLHAQAAVFMRHFRGVRCPRGDCDEHRRLRIASLDRTLRVLGPQVQGIEVEVY